MGIWVQHRHPVLFSPFGEIKKIKCVYFKVGLKWTLPQVVDGVSLTGLARSFVKRIEYLILFPLLNYLHLDVCPDWSMFKLPKL